MSNMSSARGVRRGGPQAPSSLAPTPHPKPVITLEEWEAKAPLGDIETRSISGIKKASEHIPLPPKFSVNSQGPSRSSTPTVRNNLKLGPASRPGTPRSAVATHALHPRQPIQTPEQFYDWFSLIERSVAHSQEAHFRAHIANVTDHLETCDGLMSKIDNVEKEVEEMLDGWRGVEDSGKSLKDACEKLLEERDEVLAFIDDIGTRLEYFQELEQATRILNHPGDSLVLQTDFLYMVERVDICIHYFKEHRHYKESDIYLLRFQQCMIRAMTLIKMFFVGSLRALTTDISRRLSEKDVSQTAQVHLLYTRFQSVSNQLAPLLSELERRAQTYPSDLSALLTECHTAYFSARRALLVPRLSEEIRGLDPTKTELVELTRAGCSYLKQLCTDEFNLYRLFFHSGESQLYTYLENLCDYLYDDLRPRILHEPRLTTLCEVCTVLQALMVLDVPAPPPRRAGDDEGTSDDDNDADTDEDDEDEDEDENVLSELEGADDLVLDFSRKSRTRGLSRLHISNLLQMVLQDAQTRLFFKAQSVIQSEIRYFAPKPSDLAYPEILLARGRANIANGLKEKESYSQIFKGHPSLDVQDTWYPTLSKMVWVLSQLHDFVKPAIFEDLAQEAVSVCRQSLLSASELIKSRTHLDGLLFLVRHLLILKEITRSLDIVQKEDHGDFGAVGVTDALASVLNATTSLLPNALFASLGLPRTDASILDTKQSIDADLKRACEDVISCLSDPLIGSLSTASTSAASLPPPPSFSTATEINTHTTGASRSPLAIDTAFRQACERDLHAQAAQVSLYLTGGGAGGAGKILLQHVREQVEEAYLDFVERSRSVEGSEAFLRREEMRRLLEIACAVDEEGVANDVNGSEERRIVAGSSSAAASSGIS